VRVPGSISTKTGFAPQNVTAAAVAVKVRAGTNTSSPVRTPYASRDNCSAASPLPTPTAYLEPQYAANSFSN